MTLDELIFLGACSILARHRMWPLDLKNPEERTAGIRAAVQTSKRVWEEVMDKRKEDADGNS
jgi:hypothetical protein